MRRRRAFTLIELLVVVAVVAILMAILMPALNSARRQGKAAVCMANMRSLGLALQTYLQTNRDHFPTYGYAHGGDGHAEDSWIHVMADEYAARGGTIDGDGANARLRREVRDIRRCPADASPHFSRPRESGADGHPLWRQTSYGSNFYMVAQQPVQIYKDDLYNRLDRIRRPTTTIYWVELAEEGEFATADHVHPETWVYSDWEAEAGEEIMLRRHGGRANYGMVDGHAEPFRFEDTYEIDLAHSQPPDIAWFHNKYDPDVGR